MSAPSTALPRPPPAVAPITPSSDITLNPSKLPHHHRIEFIGGITTTSRHGRRIAHMTPSEAAAAIAAVAAAARADSIMNSSGGGSAMNGGVASSNSRSMRTNTHARRQAAMLLRAAQIDADQRLAERSRLQNINTGPCIFTPDMKIQPNQRLIFEPPETKQLRWMSKEKQGMMQARREAKERMSGRLNTVVMRQTEEKEQMSSPPPQPSTSRQTSNLDISIESWCEPHNSADTESTTTGEDDLSDSDDDEIDRHSSNEETPPTASHHLSPTRSPLFRAPSLTLSTSTAIPTVPSPASSPHHKARRTNTLGSIGEFKSLYEDHKQEEKEEESPPLSPKSSADLKAGSITAFSSGIVATVSPILNSISPQLVAYHNSRSTLVVTPTAKRDSIDINRPSTPSRVKRDSIDSTMKRLVGSRRVSMVDSGLSEDSSSVSTMAIPPLHPIRAPSPSSSSLTKPFLTIDVPSQRRLSATQPSDVAVMITSQTPPPHIAKHRLSIGTPGSSGGAPSAADTRSTSTSRMRSSHSRSHSAALSPSNRAELTKQFVMETAAAGGGGGGEEMSNPTAVGSSPTSQQHQPHNLRRPSFTRMKTKRKVSIDPATLKNALSSNAAAAASLTEGASKEDTHLHSVHSDPPPPDLLDSDPTNMSRIPALQLDRPLNEILSEKIFDRRFVKDVTKDTVLLTELTQQSQSDSLEGVKHASVVASPSATNTLVDNSGAGILARLRRAETLNDSTGSAAVSAAAPSLNSTSAIADFTLTSSNGTDIIEPVEPAYIIPSHPLGLPSLIIPSLPPSRLSAFEQKWGVKVLPDEDQDQRLMRNERKEKEKKEYLYQLEATKVYVDAEEPPTEKGGSSETSTATTTPSTVVPPPFPTLGATIYLTKTNSLNEASRIRTQQEEKARIGMTREETERANQVSIKNTQESILEPCRPVVMNEASNPNSQMNLKRRGIVMPLIYDDVVISSQVLHDIDNADMSSLLFHQTGDDELNEKEREEREEKEEVKERKRQLWKRRHGGRESILASSSTTVNTSSTVHHQSISTSPKAIYHRSKSFASEQHELEAVQLELRMASSSEDEDDEGEDEIVEMDEDGSSRKQKYLTIEEANRQTNMWYSDTPVSTPPVASPTATSAKKKKPKKAVQFGDENMEEEEKKVEDHVNTVVSSPQPHPRSPPRPRPHSAMVVRPAPSIVVPNDDAMILTLDPVTAITPVVPTAPATAPIQVEEIDQSKLHLTIKSFNTDSAASDSHKNTLTFGFDEYSPTTHMLVDGQVLERPFHCSWLTTSEKYIKQIEQQFFLLDHTQRRTKAQEMYEWSVKEESVLTKEERGRNGADVPSERRASGGSILRPFRPHRVFHQHRSTRRPSSAFTLSGARRPRSPSVDITDPKALYAYQREMIAQREKALAEKDAQEIGGMRYREQQLRAAQEKAEQQAKLAATPRASSSRVFLSGGRVGATSQHVAAKGKKQVAQTSVQMVQQVQSRPLSAHLQHRSLLSRPQTARTFNQQRIAPSVPSRPMTARPASARPAAHGTTNSIRPSSAYSNRARSTSASAQPSSVNSFIAQCSMQVRDEQENDTIGLDANSGVPETNRPSSSMATFLPLSRIPLGSISSVVNSLIASRPSLLTSGLADSFIPISDMRPEERARVVSEAIMFEKTKSARSLMKEKEEQEERIVRRAERKQARVAEERAMLSSVATETDRASRRSSLKRQLSARLRSKGSLHGGGSSTTSSRRSSLNSDSGTEVNFVLQTIRRRTATETRMAIEREFMLYAARQPDPRYVVVKRKGKEGEGGGENAQKENADTNQKKEAPELTLEHHLATYSKHRPLHRPIIMSSSSTASMMTDSSNPSSRGSVDLTTALQFATATSGVQRLKQEMKSGGGTGTSLRVAGMVVLAAATSSTLSRTDFIRRESSDPEEQQRLDEALVRSIERCEIWCAAIAHMCADSGASVTATNGQSVHDASVQYELPKELDRRVIALIAAGEHELNEGGLDKSPLQHLKQDLIDGVRCLRQLAMKRLENLYADEEFENGFSMGGMSTPGSNASTASLRYG